MILSREVHSELEPLPEEGPAATSIADSPKSHIERIATRDSMNADDHVSDSPTRSFQVSEEKPDGEDSTCEKLDASLDSSLPKSEEAELNSVEEGSTSKKRANKRKRPAGTSPVPVVAPSSSLRRLLRARAR